MLLEKLLYNHQRENSTLSEEIVLSKIDETDESYQGILVQKGEETPAPHLFSGHLEDDLNIPSHVLDCYKSNYQKVLVVSNDTDISISLLHHIPVFIQKIRHGRAVDKSWQSKYQ